MSYKEIAKIIPTIQAAHLVKENVKVLKKKKNKPEDMIKMGAGNIVGTNLIKINADVIADL